MAAEVFISYASQNRDRILDLVERLRGAGVSVWIDQMGIEGAGEDLQDLMEQLRQSGMGEEELDELGRLMEAVQDALRRAVRQYAERELDKQNHD